MEDRRGFSIVTSSGPACPCKQGQLYYAFQVLMEMVPCEEEEEEDRPLMKVEPSDKENSWNAHRQWDWSSDEEDCEGHTISVTALVHAEASFSDAKEEKAEPAVEMDPTPDLYCTLGNNLDHFVEHSLQPQRDWKEEGQDAWERIERFLRDQCFRDELLLDQEVKVLKVVKGGSSGKGTTLNHRSDQDMVLFLSCFSSFKDQARFRELIISFIEERLHHCWRSLAYNITVVKQRKGNRTPRSLTLKVQPRKSDGIIRMDVLPAYNALGSFSRDLKPDPEIYEDLIRTNGNPGEFSPSFTELQRHFVKSRPVKLKNLLRLVKFWYQQLMPSGPIILDPADPTNNLGSRNGWDLVAREAFYCLLQTCCWTGILSGSWDVLPAREIQVTVKQTEKETWRLWVDPYSPIRKMKAEIKRKNGTSGELRISFQDPQGERQLLSSQKTLSDYGIFSKVTIRVLETFPPEIQVFVKESSGQSKPYAIDPGATIYELKGKVEDAGGPCTENQ
ncbi:2'-5'-oligoadenylate synthase-like protein 2, partial [Cricetulus griseus]